MPIPNYPHLVSGGDVIELSYVHTYIHTYIVSVTEAALSKLAAIFQFIQFSLAKYSPHTYSLQYPLYCILKSKGVANKAASLVTSWGGKRLLRKSSHVSMITTIGIGDKGEGGFENLVLDAWAHTITKCSEEESSKVHTVWTCAAWMPPDGLKKKLVAGGLHGQNRFAPPKLNAL